MRARTLTAALFLLSIVVPDTSSAVTIPLTDSSTFTGTIEGGLLGPGRTDGYPTSGSSGSISFYGAFGPGSIVQVTALTFRQDFTFGYACYGYYCPPSMQNVAVTLAFAVIVQSAWRFQQVKSLEIVFRPSGPPNALPSLYGGT